MSLTRHFLLPASLVAAVAVLGCSRDAGPPAGVAPAVEPVGAMPDDIEGQVRDFCGACHAYPPADSFPRRHWQAEVERGFRFFDQSGMALKPPKLAHVVKHFEQKAPDEFVETPRAATTRPLGVRFDKVSYPAPAGRSPMVSNVQPVKLPPPGKPADGEPWTLLTCDMAGGRVLSLRPADPTPQWQELGKIPNPARAQVVDLDGDGILDLLVADLGSFAPTDRKCGSVVWLRGRPTGGYDAITLLSNVGRVADVRAADFRGTGKLDLIVGVFGLQTVGELLFLENRTTDWTKPAFVPTVLDARHGTIHLPVADLNGDGRPDFVALFAQEHETVVAFLNEGGGKFRKETLYTAPHPGWGSSGIQLVDMNADGRLDVLYTNGDILDEPYLWKPYHGLQWLENQGNLKFAHHRIADMYGVHNAVAAPITGGKLPDVLAVSFLPADKFSDRGARKADAVVLFEQVAPNRFERHVLAREACDAVVCATADLFGTGRQDLIIGNFGSPTTDHPVAVWKNGGKP